MALSAVRISAELWGRDLQLAATGRGVQSVCPHLGKGTLVFTRRPSKKEEMSCQNTLRSRQREVCRGRRSCRDCDAQPYTPVTLLAMVNFSIVVHGWDRCYCWGCDPATSTAMPLCLPAAGRCWLPGPDVTVTTVSPPAPSYPWLSAGTAIGVNAL